MNRIAIIGNAGGGKTTLARQLGAKLHVPVHIIDLVQWQPYWQPTDKAQVAAIHQTWLDAGRWIIDGFGSDDLLRQRFAAADTIVFVDYPLWIHYWWATKRQLKSIVRERDDMPPNCPMLPMTWALFQVMWEIQTVMRPKLIGMMLDPRNTANLVHLRTPAATRAWLAAL